MTRALFGLLTRIRVSRMPTDLEQAAQEQHLFVLVGLIVGLTATVVSMLLSHFLGKSMFIVSGGILLAVIYYATGILHIEGLADFADGIMASGTQERKREAMKDVHLGVGGVFATAMYLILIFAAFSAICEKASDSIDPFPVPWQMTVAIGFVLAEMSGKLAINTMMYLGPSSHPGMGALFVKAASRGKLLTATLLASAIAFAFTGLLFVLVLLGIVTGYVLTLIARKHFGGVSGDAFGAANEVGRLLTLIAWVILA